MKFEFNWPRGFLENHVFINILMELKYKRPCPKGQRSALTFGTYL